MTYVPLPAVATQPEDQDRHRTARMYHRWAQVLADAVSPLLDGERAGKRRRSVEACLDARTETVRQKAVDRLAVPDRTTAARLQHIVSLAQQAFGAKYAMITVLDRERLWTLAGTDAETTEIPRTISFCDVAIRADEALIVRDARLDERFRENPMVTGGEQLRFYAGFPIEAPEGERLGALCVLDSEARAPADDLDVALLRELAHLVQNELWPAVSDAYER